MNGTDKLIIIEKYDEFVNYVYPVLQNIARKHGILKEKTINCIFEQIELFYKAIKSNQKTKLFEADANLAIIRYYFRYMDDTVILSHSKKELILIQKKLKIFARLFMKLKFSKWFIESITTPLNFLGYRITAGYKLIRKDSVVRAKRKIKRYKRYNDNAKLCMFLASWLGHLKSADGYNLKKFIKREFEVWEMKLI